MIVISKTVVCPDQLWDFLIPDDGDDDDDDDDYH